MADPIFWVCFGTCLVTLCVIERVLHAFLLLFSQRGDVGSGKRLRAGLVIGSVLSFVTSLVSGVTRALFFLIGNIGWLFFWYALLYCLSAVWFVLYEEHPAVVIYMADFYSKRVGPFLHGYLLLPLDLLNLMFKGTLPLYNGVVWVLRGMLSKGLLPILWDELGLLVDFGVSLLGLGKGVSVSLVDFVSGLSCEDIACIERPVSLDLITPMSSVRDLAVVTSRLGGVICSAVSLPLDWLLYPLIDARFSKGLHALVNAVLHLVLHVPRASLKRCEAYGGTGSHSDVLMCTPDLEPVFDHAISGVRDMGGAVDNWLGVGAAMARRSLTGLPDDCSAKSMGPDRFRGEMLSGLQTVVGLTDWLMAAANGTYAYFWGQVTSDTALRAWTEPVDVGIGVAAVSFDEAGEVEVSGVTQGQRPATRQTTSLMGCRCLDTSQGVVVRCVILPLLGVSSSDTHAFDVQFQDQTWSAGMSCKSVEVSLRSVRWPVRRYEGKSVPFAAGYMDLPGTDCMSRGSCESVDATIWLVPRCDALRPEQCSDTAVGTSCYPFCMAARVSGSRNANPIFVNAEVWRKGKQLLMRDCALKGSEPVAETALWSTGFGVATAGYGQTTLAGAAGGTRLFVSGAGDGSECSSGANMVSWVPSNATTHADPRSVPAYLRRLGQPFAITGDAVLMEFRAPDGASTVEVDRLSGNQRDVYALVPGWAGLPTVPKFIVPMQELTTEERGRVVVPLDLAATRVPSTSSRNYVFYAVSPDLRIFQAYLDYCRDRATLPRAQFMMLSSYSALRVYRVRAYCQDTCESGDLVSQFTFDGFSDGKFNPVDFPQDCSRVYNASVDALEYVNEQNVAVTVQVADRTFNPMERSGSNSSYVTYWLNPQTMRIKRGNMWPTEVPSSLTAGLCVVGDGVPHLGTLGAELAVSVLHLVNKGVGAFLYAPGMLSFWRGGAACPLQSRGHSVLASCGQSVFSLDDFFDSLDAASAVFWGIPGWITEQMEQGKSVDYSPVADLLRGFGVYGGNAVGISGISGGVLSLLNTPLPEQLMGVYAIARQPGALTGVSKVIGGATSWARFSSRFFLVVGAAVAEKLVVDGVLDLGELWRDMINTLYDQRPFFKTTVTDRGVSACLGLEMMLGGANPPGKMLYHSCLSSVRLLDGAMDVFLHAFVDAPMVKCVCKDSDGRLVGKYAREHCIWKAPKGMQPTLLGMIAASEGLIGGDALLCPAVIAYTRSALEATFKPYFATMYASLDAFGDSIDYMLSGFDTDSGQCSNFRADPQVVVIMPEPVDYFRGCGATTYCRTKCSGNWDAFSEAVSRYQPESLRSSREMERTVDSLFFPSVVVDMIAPGQVVALVRPDVCGAWICRSPDEDCLAAAAVVRQEVRVAFYCVPSSPAAVVYASENADLKWSSEVGFNATQINFLENDGSAMVALLGTRIFLLRRHVSAKVVMDVNQILSLPLMGKYPLRIIDFLPVKQRLLVSVAVRTSNEGQFERDVSTVWFSPLDVMDPYTNQNDFFPPVATSNVMKDLWKGYAASEFPSSASNEAVLILWPVTSEGSLRRVVVTWTNASVNARVEPIQQSQSLVARATLMPRRLVLSKTLREDATGGLITIYASSGSVYDWLRQLRLSGTGLVVTSASLNNAQPVKAIVSINTSCDGLDCRGCPDLALRSLCSAYQSCSVFRCIGTPVNLKRPLCGVGQVLRSIGNMGVANVQGGWVMFVDIFMILLQLKTAKNMPGVDVSFPEDSFMGNMCAAKDLSAEFFSILTSTVNSVLQRVQSTIGAFSHFTAIDASVNTVVSMSMASITGFLHQIALAPVYVLSVGHKIMMCQVNGFLAVTSHTGTRVSIQSARFASTDAISGQCITVGAEVNAQQTGDSQAMRGMTSTAAQILTGTGQAAVMKRLEPYMHMLDGALTYLIGVTAKFADVLQTTDVQHCVLPDVTLKSSVRCACGDQSLSIVPERKRESLTDFAYWCTGTLSLVNGDNRVQVVWNPYSYEELQAKVGSRLDAYLEAASGSNSIAVPNDVVFEEQGVSMFAVLTRCRQNYVNKQWDPAAFVRYSSSVMEREVKGAVQVIAGDPRDGVGQCLLDSVDKGAGNGACLDAFLRSKGHTSLYWGYRIVNGTVASNDLDACLVFSGPASNPRFSDQRRKVFQDCLGGYTNQSMCDLSGFVWSPASSNEVPVAVRHPINAADGAHLQDAVEKRMRDASEMVMTRLRALSDYSNDQLRAVLFSAEGDVIHQLMDCVFMGPYARMDYWPMPRCDEGERDDCLVGPYWSRDSSGGKTRKIDVESCEVAGELPFTCGSPTRKAMVRDFVRQYLETGSGGAEVVTDIVRNWIANQTLTWWDPLSFYCDCKECCDGYLPKSLSGVSLQVSTRGIMNALEDRLKKFYRAAMSSPEPWVSELASSELLKYNWSNSGGKNQIPSLASYHPSIPTQRYDASEAMSPPVTFNGTSLWRVCHSALRQVMYTMPVEDDGQLRGERPAFAGGGPDVIAAHVKRLVRSSMESSPLYRHYQPRHHPSHSRMCSGAASRDPKVPRGSTRFSSYSVKGNVIFDGNTVPPIPTLAYDSAVLGGRWNGTYLGLTEQLGFLDRDATERWLNGELELNTSADTLLRYGPAGLKVGNVPGSGSDLGLPSGYTADLDTVLKETIRDENRLVGLDTATLHGCDEHEKNGSDLLAEFVDGLFPMAQGLKESGLGSYCLRYAIELAMLYAMESIPEPDVPTLVLQKEQAVLWRRRCGTQVQLIGMCNALDLYHYQSMQPVSCMFSWHLVTDPGIEMYVTPECLVKVGDYFYDPCQCRPEWCEARETTQVIRRADIEAATCRLRFDPRTVVQSAELGWWGEDETDPRAAAWNTWLEEPINALDVRALREGLLLDGQSVGNALPGQHWASAEGFMNVSGLFCDMISDYWPEDAVFPVGYHVTALCHKDDASYRSFDNIFAEGVGSDGGTVMFYMEDQTRDADLVDSHFGAGGLCRGTNFGFDMYETNTMRVCTRTTDGEDVDIHVPRGVIPSSNLGLPRCSESSKDLPWANGSFYEYYDAAFFSVGTVPNLPLGDADVYPEDSARYMHLGPQHEMRVNGWGESCQDFVMPNCSEAGGWQCPDGFTCRPPGVCLHKSVQCTQHAECSGGRMCSGLGTCEVPIISVENHFEGDIGFRAHTTQCSGEAFSMRGASYWGYVPDILEAHGMCSYRHWQEYLYTLSKCCGTDTSSNECRVQGSTCPFYKFSKDQSINKWWNETDNTPSRLKMIPTTCDRDYERFKLDGEEMKSCVPAAGSFWILKPDGRREQFAKRDKLWRLYDDSTRSVPVLLMPFRKHPSNGFLGVNTTDNIMSCMSIQQCFVDVFTKNGRSAMYQVGGQQKPNRTLQSGAIYDPNDQFRCGVIGYYDATKKMCVVDVKLFPIYYVLCRQTPRAGLGKCQSSLKQNSIPARCDDVRHEYEPEYSTINDVNVPALNRFFYIFNQPKTLSEHLSLVECVNYIYDAMSGSPFDSRGLYVPFTFTLYEIPFSWFYQCMIGSGIDVSLSLEKKLFPCTFYRNKRDLLMEESGTGADLYRDFSSYVFNVRGGYLRTSLEIERKRQLDKFIFAWESAVEELRREWFGAVASVDLTYPRCYPELKWNLPNDDRFKRKMIEAFVRNTCASNLLNTYIQQYNEFNGPSKPAVDARSVINDLTSLSGNPVPQKDVIASNRLLTGLIRRFGVDALTAQTALSLISVAETPIRLNGDMPSASSPEFAAKRATWKMMDGVLPNQVAEKTVELPRCCELKDVYVDTSGTFHADEDTDTQAQMGTRVQAYSVYANGFFACSYPDFVWAKQTISLRGNQSNVEEQFDAYANLLYSAVKQKYDVKIASYHNAKTIGPIQMSNLTFYNEESALGFGNNFEFDLRGVANYLNNINPDLRTPVMCVAGQQEVNFNECSDSNFAALKQHVFKKFNVDGGVVVPSRNQLDWSVDRAMMTRGAIFSFASVDRNVSRQFLNRMFDDDVVCGASATTSNRDRICYFQGTSSLKNRNVMAPWMGGGWNPYDKCDVRQLDLQSGNAEVVDALCYYNEYCPTELGSGLFNNPYYQNMPNAQCKDRNDERTNHINVNSRFLYNLCRHKLSEDSVCNHTQGMLGGSDGVPSEDYDVDGNLYALHALTSVPQGEQALFGNVLLSGGEAEYGFIRAGLGHLGGHQLGLTVSQDGQMKVARLPLKRTQVNARMEHWDTLDTREWIPGWSGNIAADELEYAKSTRDVAFVSGVDAQGRPRLGWDCPLRRRAFYGGDVENFKPQLPSARRSKMLFGDLTGDKWAHPTQPRQDGSARFGRYKTTNGFCFCPMAEEVWPGMCSVDTRLREDHDCSLFSTVKALRGKGWGWSHTFRPRNRQNEYKTCGVQVDWPFVEGYLRDNATVGHADVDEGVWLEASDVEARRCHVLDRIPSFAYAYVSKRELKRSGYTTLDRGVCHTGRVQKVYASTQRCVRSTKGTLSSVLRCANNQGADVVRRTSKRPYESVRSAQFYRRLCRSCSPPPKFSTRGGRPMPAESSFGVPYRVSAERVIARDLREALCKNQTDSECGAMLNQSAWRKQEFMPALLRNPGLLFKNPVQKPDATRPYEPRLEEKPDDNALWARKWAYCPTREALKTSQGCNGSISKAQWRANKVGVCYATILESLGQNNDPFASTDICNMDSRLGDLCVAIREAQSLVASANCLRKGGSTCILQEFVYNPSTWETSNQAFVHQTVQEFYMRADGCTSGNDCICEADPALTQLRLNNSYRLKECPAVSVMAFRDILKQMRNLIFPICKVIALVVDIAFNLLLMISSTSREAATSRVILDWAQLKQESTVIVDMVSDMFFNMIFSIGSLGPYLKENFQSACGVINAGYLYAADVWCSLIVQQLPIFLAALRSIGGWFEVGFSVVNDVFTVILDDKMPDAMMELYQYGYREYFQSARYREKQAAYEERKEASLLNQKEKKGNSKSKTGLIPADNRLLKNLGDARELRMQRNTMKSAMGLAQALGPLGVVGGFIDLGITAKQMYDQIQTAQKIKEMLEHFPTSFTLFDFDDFYLSIDGLVEFLNADFMCYTMSKNVAPLKCTLLNFTDPSEDDVNVIAPRASSCWAEAQQRQVGVSNLYACTATSTCCSDALHCDDTPGGVRMCSECPLPSAGVRTYGCNTMLQRCQCGVESFEVARCGSQKDCGPTASCSLLTSLDDVSFGSLRTCTECATSPVCLMGSSQQYGQCSCLTSTESKVDLCSAPVGSVVQPSASKLCGFARDAGGYYAWGELSLVLCVNALLPRCAEVVTETGALIYMSVATRMRNGQVTYGSRRLLTVDDLGDSFIRLPSALLPDDPADDVTPEIVHASIMDNEWNHTSAPCSSLANAYKAGRELGPVDEATLHSCVYWRSVGRQLILEHGLVSLKGLDTFLLSAGDLAASIGQRGVLEELLRNPFVMMHALMYSQWAKPLRAMLVASHDANVSATLRSWGARLYRRGRDWSSGRNASFADRSGDTPANLSMETHVLKNGSRGRRLMGLWEDTHAKIQSMPYYSLLRSTVQNKSIPLALNITASQQWMTDAFVWYTVDKKSNCYVADTLAALVKQSMASSKRYYAHMIQINTPMFVRRRLRDVLPVVSMSNVTVAQGTGRPAVFQWVLDTVGLRIEDLVGFLKDPCPQKDCLALNRWTASYAMESALFCDLDSVMLCTDHRNDLIMSFVFMVFVYIVVSYACSYLGLYGVSTFLFLSIPIAAMWYSLGVSPRCFPMIPTCLLDDVIASLKSLLPVTIKVPEMLRVNETALRSCSELQFDSWEDPLAFAWCDMGFCDNLGNASVLGLSHWDFEKMHRWVNSENVDAYRLCASVTATYSVPALILASMLVTLASALAMAFLGMLTPLVGVLWQVILFDHSPQRE